MNAQDSFAEAIATNFRDVVASIRPHRPTAAETMRGLVVSLFALVPCEVECNTPLSVIRKAKH